MPFRRRYQKRGYKYGISYKAALAARRRAQFMETGRVNRRVMRRARRADQALSFRGWLPGSMVEKKVLDTTFTNSAVSTTGAFALLNGIAAGTDINQRTGRKVIIKSIQFKGTVFAEQAGNLAVSLLSGIQQIRFMVVVDKQPNGALPVTVDLLESSSPFSPLAIKNRDRFIVLKDKFINIGPVASTATAGQVNFGGNPQTLINWYKKLRIPVIYGGTTNGIGDITSNSIFVFVLGSTATGTVDSNISGYFRIRYADS